MKTKDVMKVVAIVALLSVPSISLAVNWPNKKVGLLQPTYDGADCFYFTLEGVAEADPATPGNPLFAIPRTQFGAKEAYATLLSARLSGQTASVITRGTLSCGYASVSQLWTP